MIIREIITHMLLWLYNYIIMHRVKLVTQFSFELYLKSKFALNILFLL